MAGHSKWANIKHRKGAQDAKRGKLFTKLIRLITTAARQYGADESANSTLRLAIGKALSANMTRDTIDRAIKRGAGGEDQQQLEEMVYEGYGAGGVAVLINCLSDNRNRTVGEVRHILSKCGGSLGTQGSVSYLFQKKGILHFAPDSPEEKIFAIALEAGAEDIQVYDDTAIEIITDPEQFELVKKSLEEANLIPDLAEITMLPKLKVDVSGEVQEKVNKLIDLLEDLDDVQDVYTNMEE